MTRPSYRHHQLGIQFVGLTYTFVVLWRCGRPESIASISAIWSSISFSDNLSELKSARVFDTLRFCKVYEVTAAPPTSSVIALNKMFLVSYRRSLSWRSFWRRVFGGVTGVSGIIHLHKTKTHDKRIQAVCHGCLIILIGSIIKEYLILMPITLLCRICESGWRAVGNLLFRVAITSHASLYNRKAPWKQELFSRSFIISRA